MSDTNRIVIAGAGTGKTYTLVQTYVEALKTYKPYEILAITFTQKAAAEMRARVIARINELGLPARGLLSAPICTFHALCAQIVGDDFGEFTLLSPAEDDKLCLAIAENSILEALEKEPEKIGPLVARFQIRKLGDSQGLADSLVELLQQIRESGGEIKSPPTPLFQRGEIINHVQTAYQRFNTNSKLTPKAQEKLEGFAAAWSKFQACPPDNEIAISACFRDVKATLSGRFGDDGLRSDLVDAMTALGSCLCREFIEPELQTVQDLISLYASNLDQHKRTQRSYGFGDLLVLAKHILEQKPTRFKAVLVDEYQDTSPIQEQLVALLAKNKPLFVVGDPKQSIYGFRGADASVFERVLGARESLNLSRRSQGAVIDLVNLVAEATLPNFKSHEALTAHHPHLGQAGGIWKKDWARQIKSLVDSGQFQPQEMVILVRRIKAAAPMVSELLSLGIPARIYGGEGFYERQEIADLAAALILLIHPEHALARLTLMRSPLWRLPDTELLNWQQPLPALFDSLRADLGQKSVAEILDRLFLEGNYVQAMAQEPDGDQRLANVLKLRTQFVDTLENYEPKIQDLWEKLDNPPKESLAEPFDGQENAVLIMTMHQSKGLEFPAVVLADLASTQPSDSDNIVYDPELGLAVTHKNRAVALCAPQSSEEKKKFPTPLDAVRQKSRARSEAELPRLLYVALTRAKQAVYVIDSEQPDRGLSLMRLLKQARNLNPERFDQLMPTLSND